MLFVAPCHMSLVLQLCMSTSLCSINYHVGSVDYEVYCQVGCDILRPEFNYVYQEVFRV
jgi:hypothetical protein